LFVLCSFSYTVIKAGSSGQLARIIGEREVGSQVNKSSFWAGLCPVAGAAPGRGKESGHALILPRVRVPELASHLQGRRQARSLGAVDNELPLRVATETATAVGHGIRAVLRPADTAIGRLFDVLHPAGAAVGADSHAHRWRRFRVNELLIGWVAVWHRVSEGESSVWNGFEGWIARHGLAALALQAAIEDAAIFVAMERGHAMTLSHVRRFRNWRASKAPQHLRLFLPLLFGLGRLLELLIHGGDV
jgi:hypothetical protein